MKQPVFWAGLGCLLLVGSANAQDGGKGRFPPLRLFWPDAVKGELAAKVKDGQLAMDWGKSLREMFNHASIADLSGVVVYLPPAEKATGAAVVICPGGGYGHLAADHEGEEIARWLNSLGIAGVVLKYRLGPRHRYPAQIQDAQRALRLTRSMASAWGVDPGRVGVLGFSAGGHLASTAATHFDEGKPDARDELERLSCRPDFAILLYPVIRLDGPFSHGGSRTNLLGKSPAAELVDSLNNDKRVSARTPPTFLVHTSEDRAVPPENSVVFYTALVKHKVPAELHIYEKGAHGLGLGLAGHPFSSWPDRCAAWLRGRGVLKDGK